MCDEFARLGVQGRAALELLALGREFGKPVILCTQGPSDFGALSTHALDQAAQDAAWILAFRQGTRDSETASRLLGVRWTEERSWSTGSETREHWRVVERAYVSASALEDLEPGTAHLRVPSVDGRRTRVEHVRVAIPSLVARGSTARAVQVREPEGPVLPQSERVVQSENEHGAAALALTPPVPEEVETEFQPEAVDDDLQRVLGRLEREGERDAEGCLLWPVAGCNDQGYAVVSIGGRGSRRMPRVYRWLWERENGSVPNGWSLEHNCHTEAKRRGECAGGKTCKHRRCCELEHLEAMPHGENSARQQP